LYFVIATAKAGLPFGAPGCPDATVGRGAGAVFANVGFGEGLAVAAPAFALKLTMERAKAEIATIAVALMIREWVEVSFISEGYARFPEQSSVFSPLFICIY
jgi:hypothetical protein